MKTKQKKMKIFTVILMRQVNFGMETSTVSYTKLDDAIKYAMAELKAMNLVDDENEEDVKAELEDTFYFDDDNGFTICIEDAKLCNGFTGI